MGLKKIPKSEVLLGQSKAMFRHPPDLKSLWLHPYPLFESPFHTDSPEMRFACELSFDEYSPNTYQLYVPYFSIGGSAPVICWRDYANAPSSDARLAFPLRDVAFPTLCLGDVLTKKRAVRVRHADVAGDESQREQEIRLASA
jgi:hypothetical protein